MQHNNGNGSKRPVLIDNNQHKKNTQNRRAGVHKQTVGERQVMNEASRQAMSLANQHGPSIQERAAQHRRKQEAEHPHAAAQPQRSQKAVKKKKQKKVPGVMEKWMPEDTSALGQPDFLVLEIAAVLLVIGLVMVFSASSYRSLLESGSAFGYFVPQIEFAVIGVVIMVIVMLMAPEIFHKLAPYALCVVFVLLVYTLFNGEETLGAVRWITIAGIRFTPSELAKPLMVICAADLIKYGADDVREMLRERNSFLIFVLMVATLGIIAKEDLGSALAIFGGCFAMFIVAGLPKRWISGVICFGLAVVAIYCIIEPYRIQRILGFLNQTDADAAGGSAYQLVQSLYAFGSGGLFGVGLGNSGQKLLYLPGMHTDFIYSVIGEELGIIGALFVLALFMVFAWRGFWLATRIEDAQKSYLCFGATAIITVQALINMGVAVGVLPVTGITLPFISYGGTSLVVTLITVGLILNMSRYADKAKTNRPKK